MPADDQVRSPLLEVLAEGHAGDARLVALVDGFEGILHLVKSSFRAEDGDVVVGTGAGSAAHDSFFKFGFDWQPHSISPSTNSWSQLS